MFRKINRGDRVMIELKSSEIFEGTVEFFSETNLEIYDIYSQTDDCTIDDNYTFYEGEVVSIVKMEDETEEEEEEEKSTSSVMQFETVKEFRDTTGAIVKGDHVVLHHKNSDLYKGKVVYIDHNSIEISNVLIVNSNEEFDNLNFFKNELSSVEKISTGNKDEPLGLPHTLTGIVSKIKITQSEFDALQRMASNYVYMSTRDEIFKDACFELHNSETVAVLGLGNNFDSTKALSLLIISNFNRVYIFDVLLFGMPSELQFLLTDDGIMKVFHDVRPLADHYYFKYGKEFHNVFDTQVADSMFMGNGSEDRSLSDCLCDYLSFPPSFLSTAMDEFSDKNWCKSERPFRKISGKLQRAAQLVVYLLKLKEILMNLMLKEFNQTVSKRTKKLTTPTKIN